jgi:hypothetical protein
MQLPPFLYGSILQLRQASDYVSGHELAIRSNGNGRFWPIVFKKSVFPKYSNIDG